jgi:hypothetical protein
MFRIISGAQTGVDQGAFRGALDAGFPIGGWYPKNELTRDYKGIPSEFKPHMREMTDELFPELKGLTTENWLERLAKEKKPYRPKQVGENTPDELKIYIARTEQNAKDSDASLIIITEESDFSGGTKMTQEMACKHGKPNLVINLNDEGNLAKVAGWILSNNIHDLNVGGPNEGKSPGIQEKTAVFIKDLLLSPQLIHLKGVKLSENNLFSVVSKQEEIKDSHITSHGLTV